MNQAKKGRAFELEIREMFERKGYSVTRGAGSKGEMLKEKVDLICTRLRRLNRQRVLLFVIGVQCKVERRRRKQ
jgi:Holliday junction resolvase